MRRYEVHVWAQGSEEPEVTSYDALDDARAALRRALRDGAARADVVNPDGIVIESTAT